MNWKELKSFIKGKFFLIGLTFMNDDEDIVEEYQTSGIVEELTDDGYIKFKREDGSIFIVPYDNKAIASTAEGEYQEVSTGKIINNADFITTWEVKITGIDHLNRIKKNGFQTKNT